MARIVFTQTIMLIVSVMTRTFGLHRSSSSSGQRRHGRAPSQLMRRDVIDSRPRCGVVRSQPARNVREGVLRYVTPRTCNGLA